MTTLREAAQQALEALEAMQSYAAAERKGLLICDESITALRAALAQEEQEPVAWQWLNSAYFRRKPPANAESGAWSPLYTAPPRREWKVLTNEELNRIESQARSHDGLNLSFLFLEIQQALKEKNND